MADSKLGSYKEVTKQWTIEEYMEANEYLSNKFKHEKKAMQEASARR